MISHVELDGKPYIIFPEQYRQAVANQMAAKTSAGASKFNDQTEWDYFTQDSWAGGIGRRSISDLGAKFAVADTRFENQLTFPAVAAGFGDELRVRGAANQKYMKEHIPISDSLTIGSGTQTGGTPNDIEFLTLVASTEALDIDIKHFLLSLKVLTPERDTEIYIDFASLNPDFTNTPPHTTRITLILRADNLPGYQLVEYSIDPDIVIPWSQNQIVAIIGCNSSFTLGASEWTEPDTRLVADNVYWSFYNGGYQYTDLVTPTARMFCWPDQADLIGCRSVRGGPQLSLMNFQVVTNTGNLASGPEYWRTPPNPWIAETGASNPSTDALWNGDYIYLAFGSAENMLKVDVSANDVDNVTALDMGVKANKLDVGGGYLWRSYTGTSNVGSIYYSSDEVTWTEIDVGSHVLDIRFYDGYLYYIHNEGLSRIGYGDAPLLTASFSLSDNAFLHEWQGRLYIADKKDLLEFDSSSIRDISASSNEAGLSDLVTGYITSVVSSNIYLYATITAEDPDGRSGVYVYNGRGWSCLQLWGSPRSVFSMRIHPGGTSDAMEGIFILSDEGLSFMERQEHPLGDSESEFWVSMAGESWVETPWLYGGLDTLTKDWESVFLSYDGVEDVVEPSWIFQEGSSDAILNEDGFYIYQELDPIEDSLPEWWATVYYMTDNVAGWQFMGNTKFTASGGGVEFRWGDNFIPRPATEKVRIGVVAQPSGPMTQRIKNISMAVIRVKYHAMIRDRWQWNIVIPTYDNQELPDGSLNPATSQEMRDHLDSIMVDYDPPFIFMDVDGSEYEVKIYAGNKNLEKYGWKQGMPTPEAEYQLVYNLTLGQVSVGKYLPPSLPVGEENGPYPPN